MFTTISVLSNEVDVTLLSSVTKDPQDILIYKRKKLAPNRV